MSFERLIDLRPRRIPRTGDDTPAPGIWSYMRRMTGWHQLCACLLAVVVAVLQFAPIELQRRLIDDAIHAGDTRLLLTLGAVYAAVLVLHRALKFVLGLYQGWLSESATLYTRSHVLALHRDRPSDGGAGEAGKAVEIIGSEIEKLGGFVGEGPSRACANMAILLGVVAYMAAVQPKIAALSLVFLLPQLILTPIMQNHLNTLTEERVGLVRELGDGVVATDSTAAPTDGLLRRIFSNRIRFYAWKFLLKASLNLMNALAPLAVLVWGGWLAMQGEATVGVLVAFVSGFERISSPTRELINFYRTCAQVGVQHDMIASWMQK